MPLVAMPHTATVLSAAAQIVETIANRVHAALLALGVVTETAGQRRSCGVVRPAARGWYAFDPLVLPAKRDVGRSGAQAGAGEHLTERRRREVVAVLVAEIPERLMREDPIEVGHLDEQRRTRGAPSPSASRNSPHESRPGSGMCSST